MLQLVSHHVIENLGDWLKKVSYGALESGEILSFGVGPTVNEIKVQKQDLKNIRNVKGCRDGMPKSMQTR